MLGASQRPLVSMPSPAPRYLGLPDVWTPRSAPASEAWVAALGSAEPLDIVAVTQPGTPRAGPSPYGPGRVFGVSRKSRRVLSGSQYTIPCTIIV